MSLPKGASSKRNGVTMDDLCDVLDGLKAADRLGVLLETWAGKPSLTKAMIDMFSRELREVQKGLVSARRALVVKLVEQHGMDDEAGRQLMELIGLVERNMT